MNPWDLVILEVRGHMTQRIGHLLVSSMLKSPNGSSRIMGRREADTLIFQMEFYCHQLTGAKWPAKTFERPDWIL